MCRLLSILLILFTVSAPSFAVDRDSLEYYLRDTDVHVIDDERGTSIVLQSDQLFLKPGDMTINIEEYDALEEVLYLIKKHPGAQLAITAHTDNIPPQPYQYEISYRQARQVADFLTAGGVNPIRIHRVSGEGDRWPIASNDTAEGRHINRRVEITFVRGHTHDYDDKDEHDFFDEIEDEIEEEREEREREAESFKGSK